MDNFRKYPVNFLLVTVCAWISAALLGIWLLDSSLLRSLENGITAQTGAAVVMAVTISTAQRLIVKELQFLPWLLATAAGLILGANGAYLGWIASQVPIIKGTTGSVWVDWFLGWIYIFLLTGLGSLPGGILAGFFQKWSVKVETTGTWIGTGILNWFLSLGTAGVLLQLLKIGRFFYRGGFRSGPTLLRVAAVGAVVGLLQGWMLSRGLNRLGLLKVSRR